MKLYQQLLYYVIIGTGQKNLTWFWSGTTINWLQIGVWHPWQGGSEMPFPLNSFRSKQRFRHSIHVQDIPSLCRLPSKSVNSVGRKDVSDLCTGCRWERVLVLWLSLKVQDSFYPGTFAASSVHSNAISALCVCVCKCHLVGQLIFHLSSVFIQIIFKFITFNIISVGYQFLISSLLAQEE